MAIWGSALMETAMGKLKDEQVSVGAILICIFILGFTYTGATKIFIPRAEAEENVTTLKQSVDKLEEKMDTHITEWRIRTAIEDVEEIETELFNLKMMNTLTGETSATDARKEELDKKLAHAKEYKQCVLNDRPNCEHLRDNR